MTIKVTAHAGLLTPGPGDPAGFTQVRELRFEQDHATVGDVLRRLGLTMEQIGIMVLEQRLVKESEPLADGALLDLYPFFGGG